MEKGFNDDELADIMNEIENLEQEFTSDVETTTDNVESQAVDVETDEPVAEVQTDEPVAEVQTDEPSSSEVSAPEQSTLQEVVDMPVQAVTPVASDTDDNVHHLKPVSVKAPSPMGAETSMSFKVEGDMRLDLSFNIAGKEVQVNVSENGLEIGLGDGAKFTLPLGESVHKHKNVA